MGALFITSAGTKRRDERRVRFLTERISEQSFAHRGAQERKQKDDAVRTTIMQKLVETGEKERLKELLRQKLIECGWRDELKEYCKGARALLAPRKMTCFCAEVIRSKGLEKITVDELVAEITPPRPRCVPCVLRDARRAAPQRRCPTRSKRNFYRASENSSRCVDGCAFALPSLSQAT